jgi:hypothetical protein
MTGISDITGGCGLNELKGIVRSIENFDDGEFLPANHTASVLQFLGASVKVNIKNNQSGLCHSDEIVSAICRKLEEKGKIAYKDVSSYLLSKPRPNAFNLMKNAEEGPIINTWVQDTVQSDLGGHYDIEQRITETNFGMFKVQCLWTYNRAPASIGGDSSWQNSGYRIVVV